MRQKLLISFYVLYLCFIVGFTAPQTRISTIREELESLGHQTISSKDDFEKSLTCDACQVTLHFTKISQATWTLRRHSHENSHQIKAGWLLNEKNQIVNTKPKGKT